MEAGEHDHHPAVGGAEVQGSSSSGPVSPPPSPRPLKMMASVPSTEALELGPHKPLLLMLPPPASGAGPSPPPGAAAAEEEELEEKEQEEDVAPLALPSPQEEAAAPVAPSGLRLPATEEGSGVALLAEQPPTTVSPIRDDSHDHEQPPAFQAAGPAAPAAMVEDEEVAEAAAAAAAAAALAAAMVEESEPVAPPPPARGKKRTLSVIACLSYMSMGGLMGLLGPSIPLMARALNVAETALGGAFAARAGGYILGSALVSRIPQRCWSRLGIMGVAGVVASILNAAMPYSGRLAVLLPICFAQGVGLAIISTLGNIVLLELWGVGAGPWLQALHFSFGVGAVISPLVLGVSGLVPAFSAFAAVGLLPFLAVATLDTCCSLLPACSPLALRRQAAPAHSPTPTRSPASRLRPFSARRLRQGEEAFDHRAPLGVTGSGGGGRGCGGMARGGRQRRSRRSFSPRAGIGRAPLLQHDAQQEQQSQRSEDDHHHHHHHHEEEERPARRLTLDDLLPDTLLLGTTAAEAAAAAHGEGDEEEGGVELGLLLLTPNAAAAAAAQAAATSSHHHPFVRHDHHHHPHHPQQQPRYASSPPFLMDTASPAHALVVPSPLHAGGQGGIHPAAFFSNTSEISVASSLTMTTGQFRSTGGGVPGLGGVGMGMGGGGGLRMSNAAAARQFGRNGEEEDDDDDDDDDDGEEEDEEGDVKGVAGAATGPRRKKWGRRQGGDGGGGGQPRQQLQRPRAGSPAAVAAAVHGHGHGHGPIGAGPLAPLPASLRWLLTTLLGLYVGAECSFGGWVSTYVLLEKTTTSDRHAAFLVSIFWAAITLGRALAVLQAMFIPAAWSIRIQLCLSLGGALAFFVTGSASVAAAAACATVYGYGMSSIYPLVMTWPAEAGFGLDAAATAHLVIGGCVGEATMPVLIGAAMHLVGPRALPVAVLVLAFVLCAQLALVDCLGRRAAARAAAGGGGHGGGSLESPIRTFDVDEDDLEAGSRLGGGGGGQHHAGGNEDVSLAGTEAGHLSAASICTPGHPYIFLYDTR